VRCDLFRHFLFATAIATIATARVARADDAATTSYPGSADKSQYTLFNPVPDNQLRDMDTDRPNRTNTPTTIDAGHVQFEVGGFDYTFDRDKYQGANSRSDDFNFGEVNARVGVTDHIEVNVLVDPLDVVRNTDFTAGVSQRQSGVGDVIVGGKINLIGAESIDDPWTVSLAVQPEFKFPSARRNIGNGHAEASLGVPLAVNLPDGFHFSFQTTPGWERNDTNTGDRLGWQNAVSVDRNVIPNLDLYVEYWSHLSTARHQIAQQTIDVGVLYTVNSSLQIDTGLFLGLNRATPSLEWTAGFSVRF
jgi:hypothetical protein